MIGSKRPTDESRSGYCLELVGLLAARWGMSPPSEHIAVQEVDDSGSAVTWGRHVRDEDYRASPT